MSAVDRYRELVGELDAAAARRRDAEHERAEDLTNRLADVDRALFAATDRAALTRLGVALRWESAVQALWQERWFRLRPEPEATGDSRPEHLDRLDTAVDAALEDLLAEIRKRRLRLRRD